MAILLDGSNVNPGAVHYNGTSLDYVYYNGTLVWQSAGTSVPDFPASIPLVTITTSDGGTTYVRNAVLSEKVLPGGDGKWSANYTCECTFEIAFANRGICAMYLNLYASGTEHSMNIPDVGSDRVRVSGVSGVPSGYEFGSLRGMDTSATFWLPTTQQQMYAVHDRGDTSGVAYGTRDCRFELYSAGLWAYVTQGPTEYALCYFSGGLIYQGGSTLQIRQA